MTLNLNKGDSMTTANVERTTQTTEDLIRESGLEKLASAPVPAAKEKEYTEPIRSCDGKLYRREILADGQFGQWEKVKG